MAQKTIGVNVDAAQVELTPADIAEVLDFTPMDATGANADLPTADPSVAGALWSDAGTVKVSAG